MLFRIIKTLFRKSGFNYYVEWQVLNKESNEQFGVKAKFREYETVNLGYSYYRLSIEQSCQVSRR